MTPETDALPTGEPNWSVTFPKNTTSSSFKAASPSFACWALGCTGGFETGFCGARGAFNLDAPACSCVPVAAPFVSEGVSALLTTMSGGGLVSDGLFQNQTINAIRTAPIATNQMKTRFGFVFILN